MTDSPDPSNTRARIIEIAARFLRERGSGAVTTRGVAQAAGVQAPAIYRLFGDKDGLLEAVAEHEMSSFVARKVSMVASSAATAVDPVGDLRDGWSSQVKFGLDNPALFALLSDPRRFAGSPAARLGKNVLEARVRRVAAAGRLKVPEGRAVGLIQSAGMGVVTTILATAPTERDLGLADAVFEGVLAQILTDASEAEVSGPLPIIVAFRAIVPELDQLSEPERRLLSEWLDRLIP